MSEQAVELELLRFPIGRFVVPESITVDQRQQWIKEIGVLPKQLEEAVRGLDDGQLDTPYRDGGWTLRQVVHHIADSHMNSYTRFKLAVTEERPTIKPYAEELWAELPDGERAPIGSSLRLVEALHERWHYFLERMEDGQFERAFIHPEHGRAMTLLEATGMYAWHGQHHVAHITSLKQRKSWE
ncbi:YfiT family bacillithiol transferase [Paenibacillus sp. MMS18-CY102]|uniref:YfiT family bacillithiol transferase n=1 Tax=Paenibacillus sp. MMS18-CY102 TaxID=2682849 RepID=UPI001365813A|nr:bacillithiol transferase BstA [Paenibacillus sp. MMS18-CY102]MWC28345.1 bacillithiol transferase BstA [Paenibacillus sp. MMS18-CY102]